MRNNGVLAGRFRANMGAYGIADQGDDLNAGSTDMANVSWVCPTIHPDLAIAPEGTPGHSIRFRDAAISPQGRRRPRSWQHCSWPRRRWTCSATQRWCRRLGEFRDGLTGTAGSEGGSVQGGGEHASERTRGA